MPEEVRKPLRAPAARVLSGGRGIRHGQIYASRYNGQSVFIGWDADKQEVSTSIDLEFKPEDAALLRDWLNSVLPVSEYPAL